MLLYVSNKEITQLKVKVKHKHHQYHQLALYNHTLARILVQYASTVYLSDLIELFTWTCSTCDGLTEGFEIIELIVDVKRCLQVWENDILRLALFFFVKFVLIIFSTEKKVLVLYFSIIVHAFIGVATDLNATVIAFRGTQENCIQNWVEDLYWKQITPELMMQWFINAIQKSKALYGDIKIMVTGNSMGGVMADFCVLDLRLSPGEQNVHFMTFGQPRIGNAAFASYYSEVVPNTIRYFPQKTYHHFSREVWLYNIGFGSLIYPVEKVCDGSGEDPTYSRQVYASELYMSGNSISDHLTYYGVQMGCDTSSRCKIVMDPHVVAYGRTNTDGNLILSRDLSTSILKLNTYHSDHDSSLSILIQVSCANFPKK
ncbi:hypothetical protein Pfo_015960 [Paulownia fortunei]|nr:hypothetical protein Pfo_015960 [Paulownia fortunei]